MPIVCRRKADRTDARSRRPPLAVLFAAVPLLTVGSLPSGAAESAAPGPTYVGSAACAGCHAGELAAWRDSQHARAMQDAGEGTVLGDFGGASFAHAGVTSTFFRRDGRYWVNTDGPDGKPADFEIRYTFGVYPLQQYLIGFADGRLQALGVAWDARPKEQGGQHWFHLYPTDTPPPGSPQHWTGRDQNWNYMCAECHSTDVRRNYDAAADRFATSWSEIHVGCEACHGPGSAHVAWAGRQQPGGRQRPDGPPQRARRRLLDHRSRDRQCQPQPPAHDRGRARDLRHVPLAQDPDRRALAAGPPAPRHPPAPPALARLLRGRRQDGGRGLQLRALPREPDVREGCHLQRLPRPAQRPPAGRRQRGLRPVPRGREVRGGGPPPPRRGLARHEVRRLPHARAAVHGRRPAARPRIPRPPARPLGPLRGDEHVQRLPRGPAGGVGGRGRRALVRAAARGRPDLDGGVRRGLARAAPGRRAVAATRQQPDGTRHRAGECAGGARPLHDPRAARGRDARARRSRPARPGWRAALAAVAAARGALGDGERAPGRSGARRTAGGGATCWPICRATG